MQDSRTTRLFNQLLHGADYNYEQWLESPDVLAEDFRLMRLAHCNVMSVGIFSWAMLEPEDGTYAFDWLDGLMDKLAEHEIFAVLATPSAAPPAWLSQAYPETRRVNERGIREPHRRRVNFCYSSPVYRDKIVTLNRHLAERYRNHPALLMWHVSNEYGAAQCHCTLCYEAFRGWLRQRYGNLHTLNRAWWTSFWSHHYSSWEQIEPVDPSMQGLMLDWQRFISDNALDFFRAESAPLREVTPAIPITTNFMQPDVGLNYWRFAEDVDVVSWDSYPRWHQGDDAETAMQTAFFHDLQRSYKQGQPFLLMESSPSVTNWQGISRLKRPGMLKLASLQAVAHGSNSVQYFQWRQSRGGEEKFHGAVVSHLGGEDTRVFRDVADVGTILQQLSSINITAARLNAPVAIVYDFENEWALNHAQLPRNIEKNYRDTCQRHYQRFWERGITADIISADADFSGYRMVIAPMLYMLRPHVAERIEQFVLSGGTFVTTYLSGVVNESDLCFLHGYPPALRRTLGLYAEELDTFTDQQSAAIRACDGNSLALHGTYRVHHFAELVHAETAQVLAVYDSEFYAGYPALTVNHAGAGRAYYIAARTEDAFLADLYDCLIEQVGIRNPMAGTLPKGVSAQVRIGDTHTFLFLLNFTDREQNVTLPGSIPANNMMVLPPYGSEVLALENHPHAT